MLTRLVSTLTAYSFATAALVFGTPVVIAAVPFWSERVLNEGIAKYGLTLLFAMVTISLSGVVSGLFALLFAKRARAPTSSPLVATALNSIPALWSLATAWFLS